LTGRLSRNATNGASIQSSRTGVATGSESRVGDRHDDERDRREGRAAQHLLDECLRAEPRRQSHGAAPWPPPGCHSSILRCVTMTRTSVMTMAVRHLAA